MNSASKLLTKFFSQQNLSIATSRRFRGKVKEGCECPEPVKVETYVQEKSCDPCIFEAWKPKTRKLIESELQVTKVEKPPCCYAGMVKKIPHSDCNKEEIDPMKKNLCKKPPKVPRPKPPVPPPEEMKVPEGDWDPECKK